MKVFPKTFQILKSSGKYGKNQNKKSFNNDCSELKTEVEIHYSYIDQNIKSLYNNYSSLKTDGKRYYVIEQ